MTDQQISITYRVYIRDLPLRLFVSSEDDPRENPTMKLIGTYDRVEDATEAAKATGFSPLGFIDAAHDIEDVSYSGVFILTVKRDERRNCRIFDRH